MDFEKDRLAPAAPLPKKGRGATERKKGLTIHRIGAGDGSAEWVDLVSQAAEP